MKKRCVVKLVVIMIEGIALNNLVITWKSISQKESWNNVKREEDLQKMMEKFLEEANNLEDEYKRLCDIIRGGQVPIGKEGMEFHRNLKSIEYGKVNARAKFNLLKYILEV